MQFEIGRVFEDHRTKGRQNAAGDLVFNVRWSDPDGTGHIWKARHKTRAVIDELHAAYVEANELGSIRLLHGNPVLP